MPNICLRSRACARSFPGVVALDDVPFRLKRGTVHALMGENGAGKSTLMKILAGIYTPDTGEVQCKGVDIQLKSPLDALENGIAMIHQELNLMPFMTVAENIWIRREPMNRLRLRRSWRDAPEDGASCSSGSTSRSTPRSRCASSRRQPPDGRDRQGGLLRIRRADHGRADLGADRARGRASVQDHPRPARPGQRHRLHHPQDERAVRDRRRVLGVPRRQVYRHACLRATSPATTSSA